MNLHRLLLLSLASAFLASTALARIERTIEKTFTVRAGGKLTVSTFGGNVTVQPGSGNRVTVEARQVLPKAGSEAEADRILADLELLMEQEGDNLNASARFSKQRWGGLFRRGGWPPVSVNFTVTVPEQYHVDLKTSGGNIEVGDLQGAAQVRTSGGNIRLGRVQGPVEGKTSGGNISVAEALERLDVSTSGGNIRVERATGAVKLHTSGGSIAVDRVAGSLDASTSGGSVKAALDGTVRGNVSLSTSGGSVELRVPTTAAFQLDASTSGGRVRADGFTITLESGGGGRDRLRGAVNGGGPEVRLRSSGGNITVAPL